MLDDNDTLDWEEWLPALSFAYNTAVHKSTHETPFFLTFLHDPRLPFLDIDDIRHNYDESYLGEVYRQMHIAYALARDNIENSNLRSKHYFDRSAKERHFQVGERVMVNVPITKPSRNKKFVFAWEPNYVITRLLGPLNAEIRHESDSKKCLVMHINRLKHQHEST